MLKIWENYITQLYDRPNRSENLEVEPEEEVDTDEKGTHILQIEVEKTIKEMRKERLPELMIYLDICQVFGIRWFENIDKSKQHHI